MFENAEVRRAGTQDAASILRIYNLHIDLGGATFDAVHWNEERIAKLMEKPSPDAWFVATTEGDVPGWASARQFSDRFGYRLSLETAIYLDPQAYGCGLANRLQQRVMQHCKDSGIHHVMAKIIADNQRSIRFHERFGFETIGVQKEIGRINDKWVDVAIMQCLL